MGALLICLEVGGADGKGEKLAGDKGVYASAALGFRHFVLSFPHWVWGAGAGGVRAARHKERTSREKNERIIRKAANAAERRILLCLKFWFVFC